MVECSECGRTKEAGRKSWCDHCKKCTFTKKRPELTQEDILTGKLFHKKELNS